MFYFLERTLKSRTVFIVMFLASRSSKLDPMLISLNITFPRFHCGVSCFQVVDDEGDEEHVDDLVSSSQGKEIKQLLAPRGNMLCIIGELQD